MHNNGTVVKQIVSIFSSNVCYMTVIHDSYSSCVWQITIEQVTVQDKLRQLIPSKSYYVEVVVDINMLYSYCNYTCESLYVI